MNKTISVISGDGIGPEIIDQALRVLERIAQLYGHTFHFQNLLMGGCSVDKYGEPLTRQTLQAAQSSDAVLLGAVGGPKWDNMPKELRPESGLLGIRKGLNLFANLRPAVLYPQLEQACPLKSSLVQGGFNFMIVRELTGGLYFGKRETTVKNNLETAVDTLSYNEAEIRRIAVLAFETARKRSKKVTSVDKANVLDSSRLWRKIVHQVALEYPDVTEEDMLVDNCAMQIIRNPKQFDVILTENMFGDILSDEASMAAGSIGMLPSASLNDSSFGLYEPSHGSAPDIAGKDLANPIAAILSASMMLRYSFDMVNEADCIESAVCAVLRQGKRTVDIMSRGAQQVSCSQMGEAILQELNK